MAEQVVDRFYAVLGLKVDPKTFAQGKQAMTGMQQAAVRMRTVVAGALGALGLRRAIGEFRAISKAADNIAKTSNALGLSARDYQAFAFAADRSGISLGQFEAGMRKVPRLVDEARLGVAEYADVFKQLGVDAKATFKLSPADQFRTLAKALSGVSNQTERACLAFQIFGRQGARMLNIFKESADGLAGLEKEFDNLGGGFDDETIKRAEAFEDSLTNLGVVFTRVRVAFFSLLFPLKKVIDGLVDLGSKGKPLPIWVKLLKGAFLVLTAAVTAFTLRALIMLGATILPMLPAIIAVTASLGFLALVFEDLFGLLTGKQSAMGEFLKWIETTREGVGALAAVAETLSGWFGGIGETLAAMLDPTITWVDKIKELVDLLSRMSGFKGLSMFRDGLDAQMRSQVFTNAAPGSGGGSTTNNTTHGARSVVVNVNGGDTQEIKRVLNRELGHAEAGLTLEFGQ